MDIDVYIHKIPEWKTLEAFIHDATLCFKAIGEADSNWDIVLCKFYVCIGKVFIYDFSV